jgi:DNA-binding CsgD family transcriptional regulator
LDEIHWRTRVEQLAGLHPLTHVYATGRTCAPLAVTEVVSASEWRRNPCYVSTRTRFDGAVEHLAIPLPAPGLGTVRSFITCRVERFTERETTFVRKLQPLLTTVDRHLYELDRMKRDTAPTMTEPVGRLGGMYGLTEREQVVLRTIAAGLTSAAAARRRAISTHTVNKHLENIYRKLNVHDRLSAVMLAGDLGLAAAGPGQRRRA